MKFCLNTSTIKPQPLIRKIELAGQAGYDGVELWVNDVYDYIAVAARFATLQKPWPTTALSSPA